MAPGEGLEPSFLLINSQAHSPGALPRNETEAYRASRTPQWGTGPGRTQQSSATQTSLLKGRPLWAFTSGTPDGDRTRYLLAENQVTRHLSSGACADLLLGAVS